MANIKEQIWRALGDQGETRTMTVNEDEYWITATEKNVFIREHLDYYSRQETSEIILVYYLDDRKFGLYKSNRIQSAVVHVICEAFNIDPPQMKTDEKGYLTEITPNIKIFPNAVKISMKSSSGYVCYTFPTKDSAGVEIVKGNGLFIKNNEIQEFQNNTISAWMPYWLRDHEYLLPNGESVSFHRQEKWFLTKHKIIDGSHIYYPVDLEGNPLTNDNAEAYWNSWGTNGRAKILRYICENDISIPEDFSFDMLRYHFYGKSIDSVDVNEFFEDWDEDEGCQCPRCSGYRIYQREVGHTPYYRGWSIAHYKCFHAGLNGELPTARDMLLDCNCKACKAFRRTVHTKPDFLKSEYNQAFEDLGYSDQQIVYLTADWHADPLILPDELPIPDEATVDDWRWRPRNKDFKDIFVQSKFPIYFRSMTIRHRYAATHCRLTNVEMDDVKEEAGRWLTEVFNSMLDPNCTCKLCTELKQSEEMELGVANELLIENINPESYMTAIFNIHFKEDKWRWTQVVRKKQDYIDYFQKYILYGKYCDCKYCKAFQEKVKNAEYLPQQELAAPKCPLCGNDVHQKDLIYENAEIAKAVIEKGAGRLIGIKTALCCSCYNRFRMDRARREKVLEMEVGETFRAEVRNERGRDGELRGIQPRRIKEIWPEDTPKEEKIAGTGTKAIHIDGEDIELSDFISWNNITALRLPEHIETEIETAGRG